MQGSASHLEDWSQEWLDRQFPTAQHQMTSSHLSQMVSIPDAPSEG
jgi:hypothetical protein